MLPWKTIIRIQKEAEQAVYLQIANAITREIKTGVIKPGFKMPGTRQLSETLGVHRQTVVKAFDDLAAQGWIIAVPSKGAFVSEELPEISPRKLPVSTPHKGIAESAGYRVTPNSFLKITGQTSREIKGFHDGPDTRLVPAVQLSRAIHSVLNRKSLVSNYSYVIWQGDPELRTVLADYLNNSRGLQTTADNLCITRGSQQAIYMTGCALIAKGDRVITGETNYYYADRVYINLGAIMERVKVDDDGIDVDEIEKLCKRKKIRAVYVTPHHHYPTTVTLSASRRMRLLALAEKYGFIIFEDDYDYDFHYQSSPILPLASADHHGMVIYLGTLSKTVAPALRLGYVSAPKNVMIELGRLRPIIDTQGDAFMERAVAEMFLLGEIRRHMKKVWREYHQRRDFMCEVLKDKLGDVIDFKIPDGGLAIWAKFDKKISLPELSDKFRKKNWVLSNGLIHDYAAGRKLNCTRMGFAWMNQLETEEAVNVLNGLIRGKK